MILKNNLKHTSLYFLHATGKRFPVQETIIQQRPPLGHRACSNCTVTTGLGVPRSGRVGGRCGAVGHRRQRRVAPVTPHFPTSPRVSPRYPASPRYPDSAGSRAYTASLMVTCARPVCGRHCRVRPRDGRCGGDTRWHVQPSGSRSGTAQLLRRLRGGKLDILRSQRDGRFAIL